MPVYLILDRIRYDSETFVLYAMKEEEEGITLNLAAARCLTALLTAEGKILSREHLLSTGWDGLVVTSNSLNQVIVSLRRAFVALNVEDDVIQTVPKVGYRLAAGISVYPVSDNDPAQAKTTMKHHVSPGFWGRSWTRCLRVAAGVALLLLSAVVTGIFILTRPIFEQIRYITLQQDKGGPHIYTQSGVEKRKAYLRRSLVQLDTDEDIRRAAGNMPYIYINNTVRENVYNYFLCPAPIQKSAEGCKAFTLVNEDENPVP